eukprot:comp19321_c0_seq1/m.22201 comp19321_c0_seq1/g.22201  ORF comp19321_c0_seq1/g.22201 comp19321_c0_seq1/m.22201 type:complete len:349 (-) comp19321_c0_seq1:497-1543(-)
MFRNASVKVARAVAANARPAAKKTAPVVAARFLATATHHVKASPNAAFVVGAATLAAASGMGYYQYSHAKSATPDYGKIKEEIADALSENANMGPTLVRLAWHSSGTWDAATKTGGSNGATMRFSPECKHAANAGLGVARDFLEPIKKAHPEISHADLWILAGIVAIEEMGGPAIPFHPGRTDKPDGNFCPPDGRLPDADKGSKEKTIQHVRDIFYRMGFNDREIVALIGAHALGRCHPDASGYTGPWTRAETTFSNEYFRELLTNKWTIKKWKGPEQYEDPTGDLMMLPADMALIWDPEFRKYVELYAKEEETFFKDFTAAFTRLVDFGLKTEPEKQGWLQWLGISK